MATYFMEHFVRLCIVSIEKFLTNEHYVFMLLFFEIPYLLRCLLKRKWNKNRSRNKALRKVKRLVVFVQFSTVLGNWFEFLDCLIDGTDVRKRFLFLKCSIVDMNTCEISRRFLFYSWLSCFYLKLEKLKIIAVVKFW